MTYSKEQYDNDLAKYQHQLEISHLGDQLSAWQKYELLLMITDNRLRNFESYSDTSKKNLV